MFSLFKKEKSVKPEPTLLESTLQLFNAVQVDLIEKRDFSDEILERTIQNGYILDPAIKPNKKVLNEIEKIIGISGEKANSAFHKSWNIVKESSMEALVLQQIIHYITTYGFQELGIYTRESVYIPKEILKSPAIRKDIPLIVVKAMKKDEILDNIITLSSGIALAKETLEYIMVIIKTNKYVPDYLAQIKNRELESLLCGFYGLAPEKPEAYLRFLITQLTGESLVIKSQALIDKIKESDSQKLDRLLEKAPKDLASIFLRNKPLFLAMKSISENKTFFNKLRKQATTLHKPLSEDYLNSVTAQIKGGYIDKNELIKRLKRAPIFRKIRLAYSLQYRLESRNSIVYRIRNGRGWATDFEWPREVRVETKEALDIVLDSISEELRDRVSGKSIYIPPNINYALPATEKQFTGNFPSGSYVSVSNDLIVGIHWTNTNRSIDLDLSLIGESGKIGWDAAYRSGNKQILFSGDMTDAPRPNGATELLYISEGVEEAKILSVNFYNFNKGSEVPCKILLAHEQPQKFKKNYMVDTNNILAYANINVNKRQNILGLIINIDGENRIYFANISIGYSITSQQNAQAAFARNYLVSSLVNSLDFKDILTNAGAQILEEKPEDGEYIDLSPEIINKTTFIDLLKA